MRLRECMCVCVCGAQTFTETPGGPTAPSFPESVELSSFK